MRIKWFSFVRVTGLLLVLVYHFFRKFLPGGFIGVDIFFAFSGYLITALLIDEYARSKKIDIVGFFKRRFYRIVPPVVIMILVTLPFALLVRNDFIAGIGQQIVAALGFMTNWYEIFIGSNYEDQFTPHLFLHTWSLAVEVHFYIFWGLLAWWLSKRKLSASAYRGAIFVTSVALFALGYLAMFFSSLFAKDFSSIYFSTFTHSFPFYMGAIGATLSGISDLPSRFKRTIKRWSLNRTLLQFVGSFVMLALLGFVLHFEARITYLFGFLLSGLFACLMIFAARILHEKLPDTKEPAVVTFFSDISYGIYLFHWPFFTIFSVLMPDAIAAILTFILSTVFSALSFYVIEPMLAGKEPKFWGMPIDVAPYKKWLVWTSGVLAIFALALSLFAPKLGSDDEMFLVNGLKQSQAGMVLTNQQTAGDLKAMSNVLVIGDSVTLRSQSAFNTLMKDARVDAQESRGFEAAFDVLESSIKSDYLPKTIVLAIGVNSPDNYQTELQLFIDNLPEGHRLILVTPYNADNLTVMSDIRDYEYKLQKKYDYVTVADWYQTAKDNPDIWSGSDGVHYSQSTNGDELYVKTIQKALAKASKKPFKGQQSS